MKPRAAVLALLLAVLLALAACSGGGGDDSGAASSSDAGGAAAADAPEAPAERALLGSDSLDFDANSVADVEQESRPIETQRSVIRKGNVELRSDDVGKAQFEVQKVADRLDGQVTEEKTTTDDDGQPAYTRMVLRIPTASFATAMADLKGVDGTELESAASSEDDVTAKVIDTRTRLEAQRRSIARITVLFDRAESISDIMRIESELSRRQAALESLERQAAFLQGQTSMSTITVSVDQIPEKAAPTKTDTDGAGFLTGLSAGWDSLTTFAVGLATALGALLPWLVVLGIVGIPAYLVWRSRRRASGSGRTPSAA
jgi:hypothetical protein